MPLEVFVELQAKLLDSGVVIVIYQNNIPVYSPALTDGSIGDMIYFHSYKNPGLVLDIVEGMWHFSWHKTPDDCLMLV